MVAPIFKFRNVKVRLTSTNPTFIYGLVPYDATIPTQTLDQGVLPLEVSTVVLTVQISNLTGLVGPTPAPPVTPATVLISAYVQNSAVVPPTFDVNNSRLLVYNYPLIMNNAFDPLSGNLVMTANDQLWIKSDAALGCDVTVSLLEIANATAT